MHKKLNKMISRLIAVYIFFLPWQTVYIFDERFIGGIKSQYLSGVFYASEAILFLAVFLSFINLILSRRLQLADFWRKIFSTSTNKNRRRFILALGMFIGWIGLTIFWSADKMPALYQFRYFLEGAALLIVILNERINPNKIFTALFLSGILPASLAVYQFTQQDIIAFKWLGLAAHQAINPGTIVIETTGRWLRAYGPFNHPNILGGWLSLSFISGLIILARDKVNTYLRQAIIFFSPLLVAGIFFSFSRSAWLALTIAVGLFIYFNRNSFQLKKMKEKIYYPAPQIIYSLLFFILLSVIYSPLVLSRTDSSNRLENISISSRVDQVSQAQEIIVYNFSRGVGLNNYTNKLQQILPELNAYNLQPVHNIYILLWGEAGIIGLIIFIYLIYSIIRVILKNETPLVYALPLMILLIIGLFDHYPLSSYLGLITLSIAAAMMLLPEQSLTKAG